MPWYQVSRAGASNYIPQHLRDVITCPCPQYLLLTQQSSYIPGDLHITLLWALLVSTEGSLDSKMRTRPSPPTIVTWLWLQSTVVYIAQHVYRITIIKQIMDGWSCGLWTCHMFCFRWVCFVTAMNALWEKIQQQNSIYFIPLKLLEHSLCCLSVITNDCVTYRINSYLYRYKLSRISGRDTITSF